MTRLDRELAGRQVVAKIFIDYLTQLAQKDREDLEPLIVPTETISAQLTDGKAVGKVGRSKQGTTARVTDRAALLEWVKKNRPDEVVENVRESFVSFCIAQCKADGFAHTPDGEIIPGIELGTTSPRYTVTPDPEMRELILRPFVEALGLDLRDELTVGDPL